MGESVHGFPEAAHHAKVATHVERIPGKTGGAPHGGGVVPHPGPTPAMRGYGEVKSGQKGYPGTD